MRLNALLFISSKNASSEFDVVAVEAIQRKILGDDHPDLALTINFGQSTTNNFAVDHSIVWLKNYSKNQ